MAASSPSMQCPVARMWRSQARLTRRAPGAPWREWGARWGWWGAGEVAEAGEVRHQAPGLR